MCNLCLWLDVPGSCAPSPDSRSPGQDNKPLTGNVTHFAKLTLAIPYLSILYQTSTNHTMPYQMPIYEGVPAKTNPIDRNRKMLRPTATCQGAAAFVRFKHIIEPKSASTWATCFWSKEHVRGSKKSWTKHISSRFLRDCQICNFILKNINTYQLNSCL